MLFRGQDRDLHCCSRSDVSPFAEFDEKGSLEVSMASVGKVTKITKTSSSLLQMLSCGEEKRTRHHEWKSSENNKNHVLVTAVVVVVYSLVVCVC